jgi:hypothetical protein
MKNRNLSDSSCASKKQNTKQFLPVYPGFPGEEEVDFFTGYPYNGG